MTWGGAGTWGTTSPWGTGSALPPPTLIGTDPAVIERQGGTVILLLGTNFVADMVVELLQVSDVKGTGYIFDARFDVESNRAWVGMPALPDGTYDLRVTTDGGSVTLAGAIQVKLHAEEYKLVELRGKWPETWDIGERYLKTGGAG